LVTRQDTNEDVDLSRTPIYNLVFSTLDDGSFLSLVQASTPYSFVHEHNFQRKDMQFCFKYPPYGVKLIPYMPPEYFELPYKTVKMTIGATGRVLDTLRVKQSSDRLPKIVTAATFSGDIRPLLHPYFGPNIPRDLKYLVYSIDDDLMLPSDSVKGNFFDLLGIHFPDFPIMIVSPDARMHAVVDLQGNMRFVAIGKYDTYARFIANGPSLWHNVLPENIQLEWMTNHIKPCNANGGPTILSEIVQADAESQLRPIIVRTVSSNFKITIDQYPRIFPSVSAKLKDSKNPLLATYEDKSALPDDYDETQPRNPKMESVRICYNDKCQAPLTTFHRCSCRLAWYCDRNCQLADWKDGHKEVCPWQSKNK
jgi:hypothetical protein